MSQSEKLEQQLHVGGQIHTILKKFKKDGKARKTSSYVSSMRMNANYLWTDFEIRHSTLTKDETLPYFSEGFYDQVSKIYKELKLLLNEQDQLLATNSTAAEQSQPSDDRSPGNEDDDDPTLDDQTDNTDRDAAKPLQPKHDDKRYTLQIFYETKIKSIIQDIHSHIHSDSPTQTTLKSKQKILDSYWTKYSSGHDQLILEADMSHEYFVEGVFDKLEEAYIDTCAAIEQCLDSMSEPNFSRGSVRLPPINIPKFSGNYLEWTSFFDSFVSIIHENKNLSKIEKFHFLKGALSNEALTLINHFSVTSSNYESAWAQLIKRYDNRKLLINSQLKVLFGLPVISTEDPKQIKKLLDVTTECLDSLINLDIDISNWDVIIVFQTVMKLPTVSRQKWEETSKNNVSSWADLQSFLEDRFHTLEATARPHKNASISLVINEETKCIICERNHKVNSCKMFLQLSPSDRFNKVKHAKCCIKCLCDGHSASQCKANLSCTKCKGQHNSLLHFESKAARVETKKTDVNPSNSTSLTAVDRRTNVMLATAIVHVLDKYDTPIRCRAIIDCGSQLNLMTTQMANRLGLARRDGNMKIVGIGQGNINSTTRTNIKLKSLQTKFEQDMEVFVLPTITTHHPSQIICTKKWNMPKNIVLADPNFNTPSKIDILIGAEHFSSLFSIGQIKLGENLPTLQNTLLGWIVIGRALIDDSETSSFCGIASNSQLSDNLQRFWDIENVERNDDQNVRTAVEEYCEQHFAKNTTRDASGRFVVRLPFIKDRCLLGESLDTATRRFYQLEKRLDKNINVKMQYIKFMQEYQQLDHMEEIAKSDLGTNYYVIPHHCVLKPDSSTTKLRVVFDASAKTSSNYALNELIGNGPILQDDLSTILTRFRKYEYACTGDITKMYRQIRIHDDDQHFQLIVWRENSRDTLKLYRLKTATYGTTSAGYLSIKCLHKLANEEFERYPQASTILKRDFYVDDLMTGCNDLSTLRKSIHEIRDLLKSGGFNLHKICSNSPELLQEIPESCQAFNFNMFFNETSSIKTLGLVWMPNRDYFTIQTSKSLSIKSTKRSILSEISQIFDPLGLVSPVIVLGKILMQELWRLNLDWDAALPMELHSKWQMYRSGFDMLSKLNIPRKLLISDSVSIEMHGFSDASERAYGAVVYLKSLNAMGHVQISLICSKSRVAPVKFVTLPRLELCAAHLLAKLVKRLQNELNLKIDSTYYWTDSEIVLSWIKSTSVQFKTFVANRISEIHDMSLPSEWNYVNTKLNPADLISRGVYPDALTMSSIWFTGPHYLRQEKDAWPKQKTIHINEDNTCFETKKIKSVLLTNTTDSMLSLINHKNSFSHLQRVVAYVLRFITNCKNKNSKDINPNTRLTFLQADELSHATTLIIRKTQEIEFKDEYKALLTNKPINSSNRLIGLSPFLDENNVIRVGGRIKNSSLLYEAKHPALLPHNNIISKLIVEEIHIQNMHCGPQALLSITRQRFWPIHGKSLAKCVVRNCILCCKYRPKTHSQVMGDLPFERVNPTRPFSVVGIDFAGPIQIHFKLRGKRPTKSYICIFVCFATKAVHIELASDLTTAAFIGCLKRFTARRGRPQQIFTDNGTNFVGAKNELGELTKLFNSSEHQDLVVSQCGKFGINWSCIPPRSPHFGGLWEAAVKSAKYHLKKVLHSVSLTYEELNTVLAEIECILNSRPLSSISESPNDLQVLTPGHFLIGQPMNAFPERVPRQTKCLNVMWERIKLIKSEFWDRWSKEYLHELQNRQKWKTSKENVSVGDLVLIKDTSPSLSWRMGRITNVIKGADGHVRVAELKTSSGTCIRAISNLCPLPTNSEHIEKDNQDAQVKIPPAIQSNTRTVRSVNTTAVVLMCMLFCTMIVGSPIKKPYEITTMQDDTALYFEKIGTLGLTNNIWNLVVYFDLKDYWDEGAKLQTLTKMLKDQCLSQALLDRHLCQVTLDQFRFQLGIIAENNILIKDFRGNSTPRSRRGLFDGIGVAANVLFGVLDNRYAKHIDDNINKIYENENHLHQLIKNHTSIYESTLGILKKNSYLVSQQFDLIRDHIRNLTNEQEYEAVQTRFHSLVVQTMMMIATYKESQNTILNILDQTNNEKLHPLIMSHSSFVDRIADIRGHLPSNLIIPNEMSILHSLISVRASLFQDRFIVQIVIPLINQELLHVYKITPIPIRRRDKRISIVTQVEYIAVNLRQDHYYLLTESEYHDCVLGKPDFIVCKEINPLYNIQNIERTHCEMRLFMKSASVPLSCQVQVTTDNQSWIALNAENKFIFTLNDFQDVNIIRNQQVSTIRLNGSGILSLEPHTVLRSGNVEISSRGIFHTHSQGSSLANYSNVDNIQDTTAKHDQEDNLKIYTMLNTSDLESRLKTLKHELPQQMSGHDIHQYSLLYALLVISIICLIYYIIVKTRKTKLTKKKFVLRPIADTSDKYNTI